MENEMLSQESATDNGSREKVSGTPPGTTDKRGAFYRFLDRYLGAILYSSSFIGLIIFGLAAAIFLPSPIQSKVDPRIVNVIAKENEGTVNDDQKLKKLTKEIGILDKKLARLTPTTNYLIINSAKNEFRVYHGKEMLRKGRCSTGSFILLKGGDQQEWLFKTPKGEFRIKGKTRFPVWKKPDWAFIEEGLPVPPVNHSSRYEYGVLGEYALSLGDGYLIHGTLYQRFLGLPVTHGCVRLNDDDLEFVYQKLYAGSKVFIY
jgi:L,D-transpeptidase ErfK/SrfK